MTERERLTELIQSAMCWGWTEPSEIAERLIEDGDVICPPCKVGDKVYRICGTKKHRFVAERIVVCIKIYENGLIIATDGAENILGKTVFLSREEAEAALAEANKKQNNDA